MSFSPSGEQSLQINIEANDDGASSAFRDVESSALDMRTAVAGAGGVLAGAGAAGLAASASSAADFEQAMADVEKVTDPETADELSGSIQDLSEEIPLANDELAELATQAGRMGADGSEEIEEFTRVAGEMGAATTLSADDAGMALGKVATALDEPLDNVGELGDSINELSNNFQTTSDEIVDSAQRSGQALDTMGLESDEILGLSAAFNEVSPTSREAAQRMQQVSESMMDPDNVEMFADMLGVSAEEFEEMRDEAPEETMMGLMDAVDGNQDALDTLNDELSKSQARAFRDTADSADTMREAMETSNEAMEEGGSLADEVATETDTFHGQMELLRSQINNLAIDIGEQLLPHITTLIEKIRPAIDGFMEFNDSMDGMPAMLALIGTTLAGLGAIAVSVGPAIVGALSPILVPVLAITAAVGALYYAWSNNLGGIRDAAENLWDTLQPVFEDVQDLLRTVFEEYTMPLLQELREVWEEEFEDILEQVIDTMGKVQDRIELVLGVIEDVWDEYGEEIMTIVDTVFSGLKLTITTVMRAISTWIQFILNIIEGDFEGALAVVYDFWKTTFGDILGFLGGEFFQGLEAALQLVYGLFGDIFGAIGEAVWNAMSGIAESITESISDIATWLTDNGASAIGSAFGAIGDAVYDVIDSIIEYIEDGITDSVDWIINTINNTIEDAVETFNDAVPNALEIPEITVGGGRVNIPSRRLEAPDWAGGMSTTIGGGSLNIPSESVGGQNLDLPQLAEGGIITSDTLARIGEAGDNEAVVPLHKLAGYLDTAYEVGAQTVSEGAGSPATGSSSSDTSLTLRVDGDDALADLIREHAELVVEETETSKANRVARM